MRFFAAVCVGFLTLCMVTKGWAASDSLSNYDEWSGRYHVEWLKGGHGGGTLVISRALDAKVVDLVEKYQSDLARWVLTTPSEPSSLVGLRRFTAGEFKEFGWSDLHAAGQIRCLDAGRLFVCQTEPGLTVSFGPEGPQQERLLARTGLFGIALHAGAFELKKE
jgi:hypothetical protein